MRPVETQTNTITSLIKGVQALYLNKPVPSGCVATTLSATCNIHLLVKGKVDLAAEISKLEAKIEKTTAAIKSIQERMENPSYTASVPEKVRQSDAEKLSTLQSEVAALGASRDDFVRIST